MKVYVDEMPKSCERCPFHDTKYGICDISGSRVEYFGCNSLTALSDHTKQLRNEVVQEIREQLKEVEKFHPEDDFEIDYDYYIKEDVDGILEKVEKGEQNGIASKYK